MEVLRIVHEYPGVQGLQRSCGVEVFPSRDGIPVVVISQLEDVEGSVSILLECIAGEVLEKFLKERIGHELPFRCIEHYPHEEGSTLSETFDLVTFADYEPRQRWARGVLRLSLGRASRAPFGRKQLEAMIGVPYVWSFGPTDPPARKTAVLTRKASSPRARHRRARANT
jgi:hypothetical protein